MNDHTAPPAAAAPLWEARSWLRDQTLQSLSEVNEQCLELLCSQAGQARPNQAWLWELREVLRALDGASKQRAARCAVLLVDAGFAQSQCWLGVTGIGMQERLHAAGAVVDGAAGIQARELAAAGGVQDREHAAGRAAFFTVPETVPVMRLVLTYAWYLARSETVAARVLLGMSATCVAVLGECTLSRVTRLAETHAHWLRPRWLGQPRVWRDLLSVARAAEPASLARMRLRGLPLLAAETRTR